MKKYIFILFIFTLLTSCEKREIEEIKLKNLEKIDSTILLIIMDISYLVVSITK